MAISREPRRGQVLLLGGQGQQVLPAASQDRHRHGQDHPPGAEAAQALALAVVGHALGREQPEDPGQHAKAMARPEHQAGEVGGVEEAVPEAPGGGPVPGGEHEGDEPLDNGQGRPGEGAVQPGQDEPAPGVAGVQGAHVGHEDHDLGQEEGPLRGPAQKEHVDEQGGGPGRADGDGQPDAHPGEPAHHHGQDQEEPGQAVEIVLEAGQLQRAGPGFPSPR